METKQVKKSTPHCHLTCIIIKKKGYRTSISLKSEPWDTTSPSTPVAAGLVLGKTLNYHIGNYHLDLGHGKGHTCGLQQAFLTVTEPCSVSWSVKTKSRKNRPKSQPLTLTEFINVATAAELQDYEEQFTPERTHEDCYHEDEVEWYEDLCSWA
jgi:hypothetical protein